MYWIIVCFTVKYILQYISTVGWNSGRRTNLLKGNIGSINWIIVCLVTVKYLLQYLSTVGSNGVYAYLFVGYVVI